MLPNFSSQSLSAIAHSGLRDDPFNQFEVFGETRQIQMHVQSSTVHVQFSTALDLLSA